MMSKYSHAYICSEALNLLSSNYYLSSEGEVSLDADDLTVGLVGTGELNGVSTIRGIGWDIPVHLELVVGVISLAILIILVVEGGTVPVNMDVEVVNFSGFIHGSNEVELDGGALGQRVGGDLGRVLIEVERRSLRITVAPGDGTGVLEGLLLEETFTGLDQVVHKVGRSGPVGEVSLDGVFLNNVSGGESNSIVYLILVS
jgi:hypothetical protein